mmetsp:Transcript_6151/g.5549  ORF Transcript_6151/g.5549 Transcript_6151/m.5549 type:complete len:80 (-) Transcript_6151:1513-1752(-)
MPGYSRSGDYECTICPPDSKNLIRIVGIIVAMIVALVYMVKSTIQNAVKKELSSVYLKIFTNHLQMISITSSFQLDWPP